jgi:16S rRNA (cytidine1402-2'-O)-methyltransferase
LNSFPSSTAGSITLASTPIGNLGDISERLIHTLNNCTTIICEDTRHTLILLNHLQIVKPLRSFHSFSNKQQFQYILQLAISGQHIVYVSDAGTPGISDPGAELITAAYTYNENVDAQHKIIVDCIPGPCAVTNALLLSGYVQ